jgi:hypothetical protein
MPKPAKKPAKKPKAVRKAVPRLEREEIRDHGEVVTAPSGISQEEVIDRLTGADQLPPIGQELGRKASAPPFDPHEGREVAPGREFGGEPEAMVSTLVFMGIDRGGDFEDAIQGLVAEAEKLGLVYITATIGSIDLDQLGDDSADMLGEIVHEIPNEDDDEPEDKLDGNEDDYGERF